ncbi:MAG: DUF4389 domain-containing protein [Pseudomonadota bacterium]
MTSTNAGGNDPTDPIDPTPAPRKLWQRALLMLLFALAFQLSAWLLAASAVVQLIMTLATGNPNARLARFGLSLGTYLGQIASFEAFATQHLPFPFSEWPASAAVPVQTPGG